MFWIPYAAAFLAYAVAVYETRSKETQQSDPARFLVLMLSAAILFRITLLFSPPTLSDDIYRYVWDGRMQQMGINPYVHAPDSPALASFRDIFHASINNRHISTIYPPLTQMAFWLTDRIWHSPYAMKIFFTLCDIGVVGVVLGMLRRRGLPLTRALIYAWNPLVLVEAAGSGHSDPLAVGLMLAALLALLHGHPVGAPILLALSFTAKFFSVVLLPAFYRHTHRIRSLLWFPVVIVLCYLPYADAGDRLFHGLLVYGDKWRFNDSVFTVLLYMTGSLEYSKAVIGVVFVSVMAFRFFQQPDAVKTAYVLVGAYLILTPTFQPWYMLWIVPLLCVFPNRAWLLLSGLCMASYHVLVLFAQTGLWKENEWIRLVQFVPFYALLIGDAIWKYAARRRVPYHAV